MPPSPPRPERSIRQRTDNLLDQYATPLSAVFALVYGATGVLLFFRLPPRSVADLHQWSGMALVIAVALLCVGRRRALAAMLRQRRTQLLLLAAILASGALLLAGPRPDDYPRRATIDAVLHAPIGDVAPVFGLSTDDLLARLTAAGARHPSAVQSIERVARASELDPVVLLAAVAGPDDESDADLPEKD